MEKDILKAEIMDLEAQISDMNAEVKKLRLESVQYEQKVIKSSKEDRKLQVGIEERKLKIDEATSQVQHMVGICNETERR